MNNFDQSSTGLNITVSTFRNTDLARFYHELKNSYSWDKSEALEIAAKLIKDSFTSEEQSIIIDFIGKALKTDLDYQ